MCACLCVWVKVGEKTEIITFRCEKFVFCQTRLRRIRFLLEILSDQREDDRKCDGLLHKHPPQRPISCCLAQQRRSPANTAPLSELKVMFLHKSGGRFSVAAATTQTRASASPGTAVGLISVSINTPPPPRVISSLCAIKVAKLAPPPLSLTRGSTGTQWDVMSSTRISFPKTPRFQPHARPKG